MVEVGGEGGGWHVHVAQQCGHAGHDFLRQTHAHVATLREHGTQTFNLDEARVFWFQQHD